ncbi:BON domain-containing protein [Streptomyces sp. NPDC086989]|uniref:BON domain-containing protein n=1 Tax=Streptomyces sp. NPDC086989 TaxID=3365764 RepID=UPI00380ECF34
MTAGGQIEYLIQHLRDRLAREDIAELGVRVETRGPAVHVWGSVTSTDCRAAVLRIAEEELAGVPWHADLQVSCHQPPDHPEELS